MPSSAAASISLKSDETFDMPSTPDFLFRTLFISAGVRPSFWQIKSQIAGSILPERVPMMIPSSGVSPMDVSTHFPWSTADTEPPFPR